MPKVKIVGYGTGFEKKQLISLLQVKLQLDAEHSQKMADAIMSGNVIGLDFEDRDFAVGLAQELEEVGARVEVEGVD